MPDYVHSWKIPATDGQGATRTVTVGVTTRGWIVLEPAPGQLVVLEPNAATNVSSALRSAVKQHARSELG